MATSGGLGARAVDARGEDPYAAPSSGRAIDAGGDDGTDTSAYVRWTSRPSPASS